MFALPDHIMKKARETITKFQHDPTSPGLNYEKIQGAKDQRLRSIRVDQDYRGIVLKAEKGDVYILLWVDKHDDAYAWARKRSSSVHPLSGAIQIVEVLEAEPAPLVSPVETASVSEEKPDVFASFSDADLRQLGATDEMIPLIRSIKDEPALETLKRRFTKTSTDITSSSASSASTSGVGAAA
jgi:hypothetical protein